MLTFEPRIASSNWKDKEEFAAEATVPINSHILSHKDFTLLTNLWTVPDDLKKLVKFNRIFTEDAGKLKSEILTPLSDELDQGIFQDRIEIPFKETICFYTVKYFFCSRDSLFHLARKSPNYPICILLRTIPKVHFYTAIIRIPDQKRITEWDEGKKVKFENLSKAVWA